LGQTWVQAFGSASRAGFSEKSQRAQRKQLRSAEKALGLSTPKSLRSIYSSVANGEFGPAYGIIGVVGGQSSNPGALFDCERS
jgi:hypothetical protein